MVGLPVEAGSADVLVVEVDEQCPGGGLVLASAPDPARGIARAQASVAEALDRLKPSLQKIAALLK
ncbi:MAG TPA: hypothetical protein VH478_07765, partial [Trebonia sp.]|nr:hypothetical protein [Trebonia sp.]